MSTLYIHGGLEKCGSSSIQAFLSSQPYFECKKGCKLIYVALLEDELLYGQELCHKALRTPYKYYSSLPWNLRNRSPNEYLDKVKDKLLFLLENNNVILSNEAWSHEFHHWDSIEILKTLNHRVEFIFYLRPPVDLLNSAWWQWGAWTGADLQEWLSHSMYVVNFMRLKGFIQADWITKTRVRLLNNRLLSDLSGVLDLKNDAFSSGSVLAVHNKGLPNGLLRLFQKHRYLRPGPHDSRIDFLLQEQLGLAGKPDWVINPDQLNRIISDTQESNHNVKSIIDVDCLDEFEADERYWSVNAYKDKLARPPSNVWPTYDELEQISLASIQALIKVNNQH